MIYAINKRTKEHHIIGEDTQYRAEDYRYVKASIDGWIDHHSDECPLPDDALVDFIREDGGTILSARAGDRSWSKIVGGGFSIVCYRPILDNTSIPNQWDGAFPLVAGMKACTSGGECHIIAFDTTRPWACVRWHDGELGVVPMSYIKALPSERELTIDEMAKVIGDEDHCRAVAEKMYDSGCRMYQHER